jgi:hypothetical protein
MMCINSLPLKKKLQVNNAFGIYRHLPAFTGIYRHLPEFTIAIKNENKGL